MQIQEWQRRLAEQYGLPLDADFFNGAAETVKRFAGINTDEDSAENRALWLLCACGVTPDKVKGLLQMGTWALEAGNLMFSPGEGGLGSGLAPLASSCKKAWQKLEDGIGMQAVAEIADTVWQSMCGQPKFAKALDCLCNQVEAFRPYVQAAGVDEDALACKSPFKSACVKIQDKFNHLFDLYCHFDIFSHLDDTEPPPFVFAAQYREASLRRAFDENESAGRVLGEMVHDLLAQDFAVRLAHTGIGEYICPMPNTDPPVSLLQHRSMITDAIRANIQDVSLTSWDEMIQNVFDAAAETLKQGLDVEAVRFSFHDNNHLRLSVEQNGDSFDTLLPVRNEWGDTPQGGNLSHLSFFEQLDGLDKRYKPRF